MALRTVGLFTVRKARFIARIVVGLRGPSRPVVSLCEGRLAKLREELVEAIKRFPDRCQPCDAAAILYGYKARGIPKGVRVRPRERESIRSDPNTPEEQPGAKSDFVESHRTHRDHLNHLGGTRKKNYRAGPKRQQQRGEHPPAG